MPEAWLPHGHGGRNRSIRQPKCGLRDIPGRLAGRQAIGLALELIPTRGVSVYHTGIGCEGIVPLYVASRRGCLVSDVVYVPCLVVDLSTGALPVGLALGESSNKFHLCM